MPAGVSTYTYVKFATAALVSMALGSQTVHVIYRPLQDLDDLVKLAELRRGKESPLKTTSTQISEGNAAPEKSEQ